CRFYKTPELPEYIRKRHNDTANKDQCEIHTELSAYRSTLHFKPNIFHAHLIAKTDSMSKITKPFISWKIRMSWSHQHFTNKEGVINDKYTCSRSNCKHRTK